jgi:acetylornithine deacetylase/succinyl-diaminopimelate desuccinylase-like protein
MSEQNEELERLTEESKAYPPEGLVTIAELPDPVSANMARMVLDAAGITSFLQGENANNLIPAAFSARLQVRPEDEAEAREVLASAVEAPETMEDVTAAESASERERR